MLTAISQGMLFGLVLCISIGPAFFGLIQTSLKHGYGSGIAMALGIFASDLTYLLLAYFGISGVLENPKYYTPIGWTGGIILIIYGLVQIFKKTTSQNVDGEFIEPKKPTKSSFLLKGYIMNLLNPFVLLIWISALGLASSKLDNDKLKIIVFFVSTLATVLGTDILKAIASHKIKSYINPNFIHKVNVIAGIILVIAGIILIIRTIFELPDAVKHTVVK
jgi:threonine/homoserine/homoserine lactone efflux protein